MLEARAHLGEELVRLASNLSRNVHSVVVRWRWSRLRGPPFYLAIGLDGPVLVRCGISGVKPFVGILSGYRGRLCDWNQRAFEGVGVGEVETQVLFTYKAIAKAGLVLDVAGYSVFDSVGGVATFGEEPCFLSDYDSNLERWMVLDNNGASESTSIELDHGGIVFLGYWTYPSAKMVAMNVLPIILTLTRM
jgi:hypothetical protein